MTEWNFDSPPGIADREVGLDALLKKVRYDLTAIQGKVSEALRMVASMEFEDATPALSFMNGPVLAGCCEGCGCGMGLHTADCTTTKEAA